MTKSEKLLNILEADPTIGDILDKLRTSGFGKGKVIPVDVSKDIKLSKETEGKALKELYQLINNEISILRKFTEIPDLKNYDDVTKIIEKLKKLPSPHQKDFLSKVSQKELDELEPIFDNLPRIVKVLNKILGYINDFIDKYKATGKLSSTVGFANALKKQYERWIEFLKKTQKKYKGLI